LLFLNSNCVTEPWARPLGGTPEVGLKVPESNAQEGADPGGWET